jgi:hypothetical protein
MNPIWLNAIRASQAAANWWDGLTNVVAVYQPIGAASLAASYVNLVNPGTFDAAPGVAPTWASATGWGFNGTDQYLETGVVPASGYSILVRFSNVFSPSDGDALIFGGESSNRFAIISRNTSTSYAYISGGAQIITATPPTSGVIGIAGQQGYRDGVADGSTMSAWSGAATQPIVIARRIDTVRFWAGNIQAVAICSTVQSAAQILAASTAMAALT